MLYRKKVGYHRGSGGGKAGEGEQQKDTGGDGAPTPVGEKRLGAIPLQNSGLGGSSGLGKRRD